jgi:hypothetical protein
VGCRLRGLAHPSGRRVNLLRALHPKAGGMAWGRDAIPGSRSPKAGMAHGVRVMGAGVLRRDVQGAGTDAPGLAAGWGVGDR